MVNIDINLSEKSIDDAIKQIYKYQRNIPLALKEMEELLMYRGILIAKMNMTDLENTYEVKSLITFRQEYSLTKNGCNAILMETDLRPLVVKWRSGKEIVSADVSPSWMLEFGSGVHAVDGHRGTFPGQKHAFDDEGWYWRDENGVRHHSDGIYPTFPMHHAMMEMYNSVFTVIKEVFA